MGKFLVDIYYVWKNELKLVFRDPAAILLFFLVPLLYPLLYAFIYNNEVVHDAKMIVVDDSRSSLSREFIRKVDASPDVEIVARLDNMEEAIDAKNRGEAFGILYIPCDFSKKINTVQQTQVNVYADMVSMLYYKSFLLSATEVSLDMGADIRVNVVGHGTRSQDNSSMQAVAYESVPFYNPQNGFASFLIPAVLILILQQTLVLGIGTLVGTHNDHKTFSMASQAYFGKNVNAARLTLGKAFCYSSLYIVISIWVLKFVPYIFSLPQIGSMLTIMAFIVPFLLAATFFAMTIAYFVSQREFVMPLFVFTSVIFLFLSGISWPWTAMPDALKAIAYIFPSTPGIHAFVKVNTMGADLAGIRFEFIILWVQTIFYFTTSVLMYHWWIRNYDPKFKGAVKA
ncbi:ABC transporter permease [Dysgonomonas sp. 520]|uniref:ABC transporter permease n=1 Tax=Dysgonomonas sp. 520 TaxID=2302931 RepID=UPI0013D0A065|nr:ABC transporter permease [Dysgonomonas sp. 520]NDW11036.1 ABC transporter permease [Dysgonomonas sp. 520]